MISHVESADSTIIYFDDKVHLVAFYTKVARSFEMSSIIPVLAAIMGGCVGGSIAGGCTERIDMGSMRNNLAGALGGLLFGELMMELLPLPPSMAPGDFPGLAGHLVGGALAGSAAMVLLGSALQLVRAHEEAAPQKPRNARVIAARRVATTRARRRRAS